MPSEFKNEPLSDFSQSETAAAFQKAVAEVRSQLGRTAPLWIDGREIQTGQTFTSNNPARPDEVVGVFQKADVTHADQAIDAAARGFEKWRSTSPQERAELLFAAAQRMRQRKHTFSAWLVLEVGKS